MHRNVKSLTLAALMAALVCVLTVFPHIPIPAGSGYVHLGDGVILLAVMLSGPLAIPAAAVGSMLADLLVYPLYAPVTLLVKALVALTAWLIYRRGSTIRTVFAFLTAELVMVAGYFVYEWFAVPEYAVVDVLGNLIQGAAGLTLGLVFSALLPRLEQTLRRARI